MNVLLQGAGLAWDATTFGAAVAAFARTLRERGTRVLATLMDNGPAWVVADAAALEAGVVHVPLPVFFAPQQVAHALQAAGVDTLLAPADVAAAIGGEQAAPARCGTTGSTLVLATVAARPVPLPTGTSKITFTSGTTGTPKGVCLRADAMQRAAGALVQALEPLDIRRHLCVLPLPVLLENLAGVLAPLARGATVIVPPLVEVGLSGSSGFAPATFQAAVERHAPHSVILLPQMLRAWTGWLRNTGERAPASLRMVAVGGAAVGEPLLQAARACGIPAYEGYGLSEGGSVQTLNLPGADRPGSAGRPLPHARVRIAADGEIEIAGTLMAGYVGDTRPVPAWWPTGDLGRVDADGFLHVQGRKKDVLITGYGRNVSPEWVETALRADPLVAQAAVFGDGQPALSAVLWPTAPDVPDTALERAVAAANAALPDYARVLHWVRAQAAFSPATGLATANGRPRRPDILALHAQALGLGTNPIAKGTHALLP
ncbi:MAG: AMP-binding protein [Ramlibacter sp.]